MAMALAATHSREGTSSLSKTAATIPGHSEMPQEDLVASTVTPQKVLPRVDEPATAASPAPGSRMIESVGSKVLTVFVPSSLRTLTLPGTVWNAGRSYWPSSESTALA